MAIQIRPLSERRDAVERIARWQWHEWGPFDSDGTVDGLRARLSTWTNTDGVPNILVALDGETPVGSVSLVRHDMDDPEPRFAQLTPWLSGLLVAPEARNRGAGSALVVACEQSAAALGYTELFLYTSAAEHFYKRLQWTTIAEARHEAAEVAIMSRRLASN